jgi:hypothetical protein
MYIKHNLSKSPEYRCWQQIKARCLNPNHRMYPHYGGRGITISPEWENDFQAFLSYVGPRPSSKHSLDRIDNNRGYEPGNVRWADWFVQVRNRRTHYSSSVQLRETDPDRITNYKHGLIRRSEYRIWSLMKDRCLNPKSSNYPSYGGRGITIYEPWIHDFVAFLEYIGPRPTPRHSIDRIDNNSGYFPGNIKWSLPYEQRANQRPYVKGADHGNYDHGQTRTPEYRTWGGIKSRCFNSCYDRYCDYGGKGITMCQRWKDNFKAFFEDVGPKPKASYTIYRLDHNGHYSCGKCPECISKGWPANCRWASKTEQNRSRARSNHSGKLDQEKVNLIRQKISAGVTHKVIAQEFGICHSLVGKIGRYENWKPLAGA